ncbi:MAG TPA: DUF6526 family protein [Planctomycetota bacterium]|nr:DUF6526 family protein [Planctomycetota bacterium]
MTRQAQSYANHRLRFQWHYLLAGVVILAATIGGIVQFVRAPSLETGVLPLLGVGCALLWFGVRAGDLKLQDRVIKVEMIARLERVLGASRRVDIARLTTKQLIALRFASDAELPGLVLEVLAGTTTEPDALKRKIRDWQPDHARV